MLEKIHSALRHFDLLSSTFRLVLSVCLPKNAAAAQL